MKGGTIENITTQIDYDGWDNITVKWDLYYDYDVPTDTHPDDFTTHRPEETRSCTIKASYPMLFYRSISTPESKNEVEHMILKKYDHLSITDIKSMQP